MKQGPTSVFDYAQFGYIPGIAQTADMNPTPDPHLSPKPYFTVTDLAHALWYSTRVHVAPIGKVQK